MRSSPSKASRTPSRCSSQQKSACNSSLADFEACFADGLLDLGQHVVRAPVEDGGGQHGVGSGLDGGREVCGLAGAAGCDDRDFDGATDQTDQLQVEAVLGAVGID